MKHLEAWKGKTVGKPCDLQQFVLDFRQFPQRSATFVEKNFPKPTDIDIWKVE